VTPVEPLPEGEADRARRYLLRALTFEDDEMLLTHAFYDVRGLFPDVPDDQRQELLVTVLGYLLRTDEVKLAWARFEDGLPIERELSAREAQETIRQGWWRVYPPDPPDPQDPARLVVICPTTKGEEAGTAARHDPDL
jgi:hypothetical protein